MPGAEAGVEAWAGAGCVLQYELPPKQFRFRPLVGERGDLRPIHGACPLPLANATLNKHVSKEWCCMFEVLAVDCGFDGPAPNTNVKKVRHAKGLDIVFF